MDFNSKKNYFLLFGSKTKTIDELRKDLYDKLDLDFEARTSLYVGDYYQYHGLYADSLTIEYNDVDGDYKEVDFSDYITLIYATYNQGRNKDRKDRAYHMRGVVVNHVLEVDYLRERILNDDGSILEELSRDKIKAINANARKNYRK